MSLKLSNTTTGLARILAALYMFLIGWIILVIVQFGMYIYGSIDIVLNLLGHRGISANSAGKSAASGLHRGWEWGVDQLGFIIFGEGSMEVLP